MPHADLATGVRLFYEDSGPGQPGRAPIVAVHGWLGTARTDLGHVIDWLHADLGHRVIGPSLRGYGLSRPPQRDFPPDFYHRDAADLLALLGALDLPAAHLFGYSDGGEVALIAAGTRPDLFLSVATVGAVGYFGPDMRAAAQRSYPATWLEAEPDTMVRHGIVDANAFVLGWIGAVRHMIDAGGDVSLSLAPHIAAPLLVMLGDTDTLNPQAYGQRLVDAAPRGRLMMFRCGHAIHDQQPDAFRAAYARFLGAV